MTNSLHLDQKVVATIKGLIMDGIRQANSGHTGGALSSTDFAYILFKEFLQFNPDDPDWFNRDRFVLSAGHESMLLYSLLTLVGYLKTDDLMNFRQLNSLTPGHPESDLTPGVEATTGPLGQGVGMSVGMAVSETMLQAKFGTDIVNHFTYVLAGDGDLQEPVSLGAASIAGHLKLNKLIMFYDRNQIQISGPTSRADSTDIAKVFEGFGWHIITIDGHDHEQIRQAIRSAQNETNRPSLIIGNTTMAKGTATREGDHETHGVPLPPEEIKATKEKLGLPGDHAFYIPEDALAHFRSRYTDLKDTVAKWDKNLSSKQTGDNGFNVLWNKVFSENSQLNLKVPQFETESSIATRSAFGKILAAFAEQIPNLVGGSADLEPSNNTKAFMETVGEFSADNRKGRNLSFGVREFPMGALLNGMILHGGIRGFGATFLVFADYERPALRLSAMQKLPALHVFTHDSFYVGEDGPTHQPVEHLASLRTIPNFLVLRPAEAKETAYSMQLALKQDDRPSALALTRQNLPVFSDNQTSLEKVAQGGYIIEGDPNVKPDMILIASGSEVHLALATAKLLSDHKVRVVSMPCMELFNEQTDDYKNQVIPADVTYRVAIEAGATFGWDRYTGLQGWVFGLDHYGKSAPYKELEKTYGFVPENLAKLIEARYKENR